MGLRTNLIRLPIISSHKFLVSICPHTGGYDGDLRLHLQLKIYERTKKKKLSYQDRETDKPNDFQNSSGVIHKPRGQNFGYFDPPSGLPLSDHFY